MPFGNNLVLPPQNGEVVQNIIGLIALRRPTGMQRDTNSFEMEKNDASYQPSSLRRPRRIRTI